MSKFYKKFSLSFASFSLAVLVFGVFIPVQASAASLNKYVIQLSNNRINLSESAELKNIQPLFQFNADKKFANTYQFQSAQSLEQLKSALAGYYISLEIDHPVQIGRIKTEDSGTVKLPNDPGFTTNSANIDKQWGLVKANFIDAWKKTVGEKRVIVAIIDTGIDGRHEDLSSSRFVSGYDVISDTKISGHADSDDNGHGTLIAGVIAATSNNDTGITGAASGVSIMPIKALDGSGSGTSSQISEAIVWAVDHGANVVNLSLGGIGFAHDKVLADAITYAYDRNVLIVAAAGNDVAITGGNLDKDPVFPICDDNGKNMIIGVTATDVNDLKPSFANYGKACVDVSAPGKRILSTINHDPANGSAAPDSYAYASGTSLAVPFVSAQAALLYSLFPEATNKQIRDRIIATADNVDKLNISQCAGQSCSGLLGGGRINVASSIKEQIIKLKDGDLVQVNGTDNLYYINGGKKQLVSPFVKNQRFPGNPIKVVLNSDLESYPEGSYAEPLNGTLVKSANEPAVYYMETGLRRPVTYQVFMMRGYNFSDVVTLTNVEVGSWVTGSFITPPDNTLLRSGSNPTLYWVINSNLRPLTYQYFISRELNKLPVIYFPDGDIAKFPKGEPFIN